MVQTFKQLTKQLTKQAPALLLLGLFAAAAFAQQDPPSRVARLNYVNGQVSMEPAAVDDWSPAAINRPFSVGDYLYTDQSSVAELHLDIAVIRMGEFTNFGFLNLNDQTAQLKLTEGEMYFRIRNLGPNDVFEVDTPNAAITLLRDGLYRINVDPKANTTFVITRSGEAEITGGGQAFTLAPGNSASLSGTDQLAFEIESAPQPDSFDTWCGRRDAHEAHLQSARYVPPALIGYEDLDDYGSWTESQDYGAVWCPRSVAAGWAPYHNGHWAWVEPWGWTWVDDAPWGFAPFHYGRWVYWQNRWGWTPGPGAQEGYGRDGYERDGYEGEGYRRPVFRPVYAPAMVAWLGGAHWGLSLGLGGGPRLGWVPLGYGEVYTPSYTCSRPYFKNVNVNNTRIEKTVNITNVYNNVYVNKTAYNQTYVNVRAPNAVAAMPQNAFASGRPVNQAGYAVRPADFARMRPAQSTILAPLVAPTRQALAPGLGQPTVRPAAQVSQRQVIARNVPPTQPASFAAQQSFLQQHAGQPHNYAAMHEALPQQRQVGQVRQAPPVRPTTVIAGQQGGSVSPRIGNTPAIQPRGQFHTREEPNAGMDNNGAAGRVRASPTVANPAGTPPAASQHGFPPNLRQDPRMRSVPNTPAAAEQVRPRPVQPSENQPRERNSTVPAPRSERGYPERARPQQAPRAPEAARPVDQPRRPEPNEPRPVQPSENQPRERNSTVPAPRSERDYPERARPQQAPPPRAPEAARPADQPRRAEPNESRNVQPRTAEPRAEEHARGESHSQEPHGTPPSHEERKPDPNKQANKRG